MTIQRKEVKETDKWDLESVYSDSKAWEADLKKVESLAEEIANFKKTLADKKNAFICLKKFFYCCEIFEKLYNYAHRRADEDLGDSENGVLVGKIDGFYAKLGIITAFIEPEFAACDNQYLEELLFDKSFSDYTTFIKSIMRDKKHLLTEKEEALLSGLSEILDSPRNIASKLINVNMSFKPIRCEGGNQELTDGNFRKYLEHKDRRVRKRAMKNTFHAYRNFRDTLSESLTAHIKGNVAIAKARHYPHILDLFLNHNAIPSSVYKTLFSAANDNLPLLQRYCEVRKKAMNLRKLHWYDLYVPIVAGVSNTFSYDKATDIVRKAVVPLGNEYAEKLFAGLTGERWVDKFENKGKMIGAYSAGSYESKPFILMNYNDTLDSLYTLGHEGGHSMHSLFSSLAQPYPKYEYTIFLAEIASTFNENLISEYLLEGADKSMRAYILNKKLESIRNTFFRQTMFAEFEAMLYDEVWNGNILTPDYIEKEYFKLNRKYYGPNVVIDDEIHFEWSRIPHFFYNFYVYQYATGIACASYFTKEVLQGGDKERNNYLNMLHAGGSDYPVSILKKAGLDVTKPDYILATMKDFEETLNEFEKLI